eukprot:TRINITY_DN66601_c10_g4_i1.p1 TRINITY_DN66601_c10_g4~~TRINITY_DN66601_c10_g4_i1.p1  ORF type:complete len:1537 (-),score=824.47 TRINITY_DN66601_c10_g4_i1:766-5079(-)
MRVLVAFISIVLQGSPLLVTVKNGQFMDSLSWKCLARVTRLFENSLVVVASRPLVEDDRDSFLQYLTQEGILYSTMSLRPLTVMETKATVMNHLGIVDIDPKILTFIYEKTQGHPQSIIDMVQQLLLSSNQSGGGALTAGAIGGHHDGDEADDDEDGVVERKTQGDGVDPSVAGLVRNLVDIVPQSMQEVMSTRMKSLNKPLLLLLQVASVVGEKFDLYTLACLHPENVRAVLALRQKLKQQQQRRRNADGRGGSRHRRVKSYAVEMMSIKAQQRSPSTELLSDLYRQAQELQAMGFIQAAYTGSGGAGGAGSGGGSGAAAGAGGGAGGAAVGGREAGAPGPGTLLSIGGHLRSNSHGGSGSQRSPSSSKSLSPSSAASKFKQAGNSSSPTLSPTAAPSPTSSASVYGFSLSPKSAQSSFASVAVAASKAAGAAGSAIQNMRDNGGAGRLISPLARKVYEFRSPMVLKLVYSKLNKRFRSTMHTQLAEMLEDEPASNRDETVLAHHWSQADNTQKNLQYTLGTARKLLVNNATADAVSTYKKALALYERIKNESLVDRFGSSSSQRHAFLDHLHRSLQIQHIHLDLARAHRANGSFLESNNSLREMLTQLGFRVPGSAAADRLSEQVQELAEAKRSGHPGAMSAPTDLVLNMHSTAKQKSGRSALLTFVQHQRAPSPSSPGGGSLSGGSRGSSPHGSPSGGRRYNRSRHGRAASEFSTGGSSRSKGSSSKSGMSGKSKASGATDSKSDKERGFAMTIADGVAVSDPARKDMLGCLAFELLAQNCYEARLYNKAMYSILCSLRLAESSGCMPALARGYGLLAVMCGEAGYREFASLYMNKSLGVIERHRRISQLTVMEVKLSRGQHMICTGDWEAALDVLQTARRHAPAFKERSFREIIHSVGVVLLLRGEYPSAQRKFEDLVELARLHRDHDLELTCLNVLALVRFAADDPVSAIRLLDEANSLAERQEDTLNVMHNVLLSISQLRTGVDGVEVEEFADRVWKAYCKVPLLKWQDVVVHMTMADFYGEYLSRIVIKTWSSSSTAAASQGVSGGGDGAILENDNPAADGDDEAKTKDGGGQQQQQHMQIRVGGRAVDVAAEQRNQAAKAAEAAAASGQKDKAKSSQRQQQQQQQQQHADNTAFILEKFSVPLSMTRNDTPGARRQLQAKCRLRLQAVVENLKASATRLPCMTSVWKMWCGVTELIAGRKEKAFEEWDAAATLAVQQGMRMVAARCHYLIGYHMRTQDQYRRSHLLGARRVFVDNEAHYYRRLADFTLSHVSYFDMGASMQDQLGPYSCDSDELFRLLHLYRIRVQLINQLELDDGDDGNESRLPKVQSNEFAHYFESDVNDDAFVQNLTASIHSYRGKKTTRKERKHVTPHKSKKKNSESSTSHKYRDGDGDDSDSSESGQRKLQRYDTRKLREKLSKRNLFDELQAE